MPGNVPLSLAFSPTVLNTDETTHDLYARHQQTFTEKPISNCVMSNWATRLLAQILDPAGSSMQSASITWADGCGCVKVKLIYKIEMISLFWLRDQSLLTLC